MIRTVTILVGCLGLLILWGAVGAGAITYKEICDSVEMTGFADSWISGSFAATSDMEYQYMTDGSEKFALNKCNNVYVQYDEKIDKTDPAMLDSVSMSSKQMNNTTLMYIISNIKYKTAIHYDIFDKNGDDIVNARTNVQPEVVFAGSAYGYSTSEHSSMYEFFAMFISGLFMAWLFFRGARRKTRVRARYVAPQQKH